MPNLSNTYIADNPLHSIVACVLVFGVPEYVYKSADVVAGFVDDDTFHNPIVPSVAVIVTFPSAYV